MKDYYATLKIQQGRLKTAMREMGIKTVAELSRRSGISQHVISGLLNFRTSPRCDYGREWRTATLAICKTLGYEANDLFPDHLDHEIPTNQITAFVEHAQLSGRGPLQLGPCEEYERKDIEQTLNDVLETLNDREQDILKARFWDNKTLEEIARDFNVTRTRIAQIEAKAIRKLGHPVRRHILEEIYTPTA